MQTRNIILIPLMSLILATVVTGCFEPRANYQIPKDAFEVNTSNIKYWITENVRPIQLSNTKTQKKNMDVRNLLTNTASAYYESYFRVNMLKKTQEERHVIAACLEQIIQDETTFLNAKQSFQTHFPNGLSKENREEISQISNKELTPVILFQVTHKLYDLCLNYMHDKTKEVTYTFTRAVALDLIDQIRPV